MDANGVIGAVYDPSLRALRVSGGSGTDLSAEPFVTTATSTNLTGETVLGTSIILAPGLDASKPLATAVPAGAIYGATDTNLLYRSTHIAWVQMLSGDQTLDADLTAIAALTSAADQLPYATGAQAWAMTTLTAFARTILDDTNAAGVMSTLGLTANGQSLVTAADYAAMKVLLGLVIGTNVQAYDADLTTWAGLTPSANAQSLVTAASYAAMRVLLGTKNIIGTVTSGASAATRYMAAFQTVLSTTQAAAAQPMPAACTVSNLRIQVATAPGLAASGKKWDFALYKNGSATALVGTILETATAVTCTGGPITYADGDTWSIENAATSTPASTTFSFQMELNY